MAEEKKLVLYPDADIANADWPKRTPDRLEDLQPEGKEDEDKASDEQ